MRGHREAASDSPPTASSAVARGTDRRPGHSGQAGWAHLGQVSHGATPRGWSVMVSSSLLGHGNAAPRSSPRPSPRGSSICSSGKKKISSPLCSAARRGRRRPFKRHDTLASAPSRSTSPRVSMVTLRTAMGRRVDVKQLVRTAELGGVSAWQRPDRCVESFRRRLPGACRASWCGERGPRIWYRPAVEPVGPMAQSLRSG